MIASSKTAIFISPHQDLLTVNREYGPESFMTPRIIVSYTDQTAEFSVRLTSKDADNLRKALDLVIDKSLCD